MTAALVKMRCTATDVPVVSSRGESGDNSGNSTPRSLADAPAMARLLMRFSDDPPDPVMLQRALSSSRRLGTVVNWNAMVWLVATLILAALAFAWVSLF